MANPDEPVCRSCAPAYYAEWPKEAIICAIQEWADDHGGIPPAATDFMRARGVKDYRWPAVNNVQRLFGKWSTAIRAAGFEPHPSGPVGGFTVLTPDQRNECARRYRKGETSTAIAHDLGCTPSTVMKWVRKAGVQARPPAFGRAA